MNGAKNTFRVFLLILASVILDTNSALARVTITTATGGESIPADTAATAASPAWTTLGPITISERKSSDFSAGTGVTLILEAPAGFQFNTAVTPSVTYTAGRNITSASAAMTDSSTITITLNIAGTGSTDTLNIGSTTGIQVQPTAVIPLASGDITVGTSSTASVSGITEGSTSLGTLREVAGAFRQLQLLVPGETAAPGTPAGKTGTPVTQMAGTAFNVTVNAVDANWIPVSTNDTVRITSSDPNATLPAPAALSGGTRTFSVTLRADSATLTAFDLTHPAIASSTSPPIVIGNVTPVAQMRPVVAIHDSELTRALAFLSATNATPSGPGTTGFEWWPTNWPYFVMPESVKELLHSDGTVFEVVGDVDISAGRLLATNGQPRCPIVISLASEAVRDDEIAPLTNYVAAGGTLLVGSSAFTRHPDGTTRGDFALASQMGLHMVNASLLNWAENAHFSKTLQHSLVAHLPGGMLDWQLPAAADEVPWGISPSHALAGPHAVWQVQPSDAVVIAQGTVHPYLTIKPYGKGRFIYCAAMQPLIGHGGNAPGMYAYGIFRKAIELAFTSAQLPVPKLSPWPYAYDAALNVRHDLENYQPLISEVESSAQYEAANGVNGDYYFCTGTLREEMTNSAVVIAGLRRAVSNYGATIGSHNGGLHNPNNPSLVVSNYDYWHWGPDEALDVTPAGYVSGKAYAWTSISNSFRDLAGWVPGLTYGIRSWVGCYFNSIREDSYDILEQLNVKTAGEQKLGPFPHWTVSTRTPGKRYSFVSLPVSDWYVGTQLRQAMESGHTVESVRAAVDFYYDWGGLINIYSHSLSDGRGYAGALVQEYISHSVAKPRIWSTNAAGVYAWWLARSGARVTASYSTNGNQATMTLSLKGATDGQTAVEVLVPQPSYYDLAVLTNGTAVAGSGYRTNGQWVKVLVGSSVTNAEIRYSVAPSAADDLYYVTQDTLLTIPAPGVLGNDLAGLSGVLRAALVSEPAHGSLVLSTNGGFSYTPATNFSGVDSFSYRVSDGVTTSGAAVVTICVTPVGQLFADDFVRSGGGDPLAPWQVATGDWTLNSGVIQGTSAPLTYGFAYVENSWTDYSVQAQLQFPAGAFGGGLGGRLNPMTGARYAAWIYPETPPGSLGTLKLFKFQNWSSFSLMDQVSLPSVGTGWHAVKMAFRGNWIGVYYDGNLVISVTDDGAQPYLSGGISLDMWTWSTPYVMSADEVVVGAGGTDQTITFGPLADKSYGDPPFTVGATASSGLPVTFSILSGAATIADNAITLSGAGTVKVRASQFGDMTYNPAEPVDQTFRVAPAPDGLVFADAFARSPEPASLSPWIAQQGIWAVTNEMLQGSIVSGGYSYAYIGSSWTNYSVEGHVQLSSPGGWGGGIGGRLDPVTGAHYGAWVYPGGSPGGANLLKLVKFSSWTSWGGTPMVQAELPEVGTNWHTLKLEFLNNQITVYFDGLQVADVIDDNFGSQPAYLRGGITADMYTSPDAPYFLSLDNVLVRLIRPTLAVVADDASRPYGAPDPAFTGSFAGLQEGDNITASYSTTAETSSPIGAYSIVPVLNDPDHKLVNYSLTVANGTLTVTPGGSALSLTSSHNPSSQGASVTFTATVSPVAPAASTPSGNVQFYANGTAFGSPVLLADGIASLGTAGLPVGTNTILAAYPGDGNFIGSTNSIVQLVILNADGPRIVDIQASGEGMVAVTFAGIPGTQYIVQACTELTAAAWENVSTNMAGTDGRWTFTESVGSVPQRYYRATAP